MSNVNISIKAGRKGYSTKTKEFLADTIINDEAKESLLNLMGGKVKALKVKEANNLLRIVLLSIVIDNGIDDIRQASVCQPTQNKQCSTWQHTTGFIRF